jgi:hypothetical protein
VAGPLPLRFLSLNAEFESFPEATPVIKMGIVSQVDVGKSGSL